MTPPRDIDALYAKGVEAWRGGDSARAADWARAAIAIDAKLPALHYLLGCAELDAERFGPAESAFDDAIALAPKYPLVLEARLRAALARARAEIAQGISAPVERLPEGPLPSVSVVICSARPERLARSRDSWRRTLSGIDHEIVAITDARSLAEGYNRGLASSCGARVLFSHDDAASASPDFGARLLRHLERADVIGVAGTVLATAPSWLGAGWPRLAGQIATPGDGGRLNVTVFGPCAFTGSAQALDGVFIACRREAAETLQFDAATFDGWHGYDFDFSFRAHRAGLRCAVAGDLLLVHDSTGAFDTPAWRRDAERALAKHRDALPKGAALPKQPELCSLEVRSAEEWRQMSARLIGFE